jgi:predicted Zn-dependent protease with MMP-like domain
MQLPRIQRDRHGRGMRGPLAPPDSPASVSRAQRFDDYVLESVERLDRKWRDQLQKVEVAVEDVPVLDDWDRDWVPLARAFTATGALPARIVVYRRPIETRTSGARQLRMIVHEVVVEQVAELLGVEPEEVDPAYGLRG